MAKNPYDPYNPWDKEEDEVDEYYRRAFGNQPRVGLLTPRVPPKPPPPPPEPIPKVKDPIGPLRIRVVEDSTGKPIPNVKISFWNDDLPPLYTNDDGIAENSYAPGKTYIVECPPDKFMLTEVLDFVGEGETPIHPPMRSEEPESSESESDSSLTDKDKKSKSSTSRSRKPEYKIAHVIEYKVKTGDSFMTACARGAGLIPMIGAYFNWGVRTNEEIQEKLRDYVGCTEKDEDGDYILDDSNDPGIIYLYKKWEMTGVLINEMRTVRVRKIQPKKSLAFDVNISLVRHSDGFILTPLQVRDFDELNRGSTNNQPYAAFEIEVEDNSLDSLEVEVTTRDGRVWYQELREPYLNPGKHPWNWGGYNDARILDTKVLKDPTLKLELRATRCGVQKTRVVEFDNEAAECDWVDIKIDANNKTVEVELRLNLEEGSSEGLNEYPPTEIFARPPHDSIPVTDSRRQVHVRNRSFADLLRLALAGVGQYWSRDASNGKSVNTSDGAYQVTTRPVVTSSHAMDDVDLKYNTNRSWGRSSNPGSVTGILSLFGNFVPERVIYNVGWLQYGDYWVYRTEIEEDPEFKLTAAHEIGHEILNTYGGDVYSYGHRGSSSPVFQTPNDIGDGAEVYPSSGEIDLMKYYHGYQPGDAYTRTVACEVDVYSLIWLARVEFDD